MNPTIRLSTFIFALLALLQTSLAQTDLRLWFDTPATQFTQSLPLGNGRLGAMVFGGVNEERIVVNESSRWSGGPQALTLKTQKGKSYRLDAQLKSVPTTGVAK